MGILKVNGQEQDILSAAYLFQSSKETPHILGLKGSDLARLLSVLGQIQSVTSNVIMVGDLVQVKYRIGRKSDEILKYDEELRLVLSSSHPYLQVSDIGEVNKIARQFAHT